MPAPLPFSPVLATTNIIEVYQRCDTVDKVIVAGLAIFSLVAWTIMFGKNLELKRMRQLNHSFEAHLRDQRSLLDLPESFRNKRSIPYADVFADAVESYWRAAAIGKEKGADSERARLEHAENAIQRSIARQTLRYESSMIFLASIVSGAPFLGLLGTVWGVMEAFSAVGVTTGARMRLAMTDIARNRAISRRRTIPYLAMEDKGMEVALLHKPRSFARAIRPWTDGAALAKCAVT